MSDELYAYPAPDAAAIAAVARRSEDDVSPARLAVLPDRLLQDWKEAYDRALTFLTTLGVPASERERLAHEATRQAVSAEHWEAGSDAVAETLRALRLLLSQRVSPRRLATGVDAFGAWRLDTFLSSRETPGATTANESAPELTFSAMPPLTRRAMKPERIERRFLRRLFRALRPARPSLNDPEMGRTSFRHRRKTWSWTRVAHWRRFVLTVLVLIPSVVASGFMVNVLPRQGGTWLEAFIVVFFGALFGWISIGFWTAIFGFFTLVGRRDRFAITNLPRHDPGTFNPGGRTAIVMPIFDEPVERVFAGLQAIYRSLERTGALPHFDFFILSDSNNPSTCVHEEEAWATWCRAVNGFGKIFYRHRRVRVERKSGNVADFCRRWGVQYRYMIMLDADSIMAGSTLVRLVELMEQQPDAGMIQTAPVAVNRRSLFARVQQFASRVYGPMFAAGLHFWQLGDGQYWGHNTIIRVRPFMDHCALTRLPGRPPLGGEILSHDFVEAALMGRAGWTLWLAFDLEGSYEEVPSTLLEEMKRDRRWCQGNLQHLRLLFTEGLFGAHRALFLNGVLSYVSALLWFGFLTLSTVEAIVNALRQPDYFPHGPSLFPEWPVWRPDWALALLSVTAMILFLPKILSILLVALKGRNAKAYGGVVRLTLSVLLEILLSSLLAPIRMVFHSRFVLLNLLGRTVTWRSQVREDSETGWAEAIRHHGLDSLFASAWAVSLYWLNPDYFWWVTPIIGALILSVPVSVFASRVNLGDRTRRWKLFLIPEESNPPQELRDLYANLAAAELAVEQRPRAEQDGFVRAVVDPYVNAIHRTLLRGRRSVRASIRAARNTLLERGLHQGPAALTPAERKLLLIDPELVTALHERVWSIPNHERAALWGILPGS